MFEEGMTYEVVSIMGLRYLFMRVTEPTPLAKPGVSGIQATNQATTARQFVPYWL
jgi:hypothetical protein